MISDATNVVVGNYHWSTLHIMGLTLSIFFGVFLIIFAFITWTHVYRNGSWPWEAILEAKAKKRHLELERTIKLKEADYHHQEEMARIENQKFLEQNKIFGG